MFKFLHAADLHLDSPLRGLEQYEGAPTERIRRASRRALERLVKLAIDDRVDFVLLAGDLYDGDWKDYSTGQFFITQMVRLREANIPVIAIAGNHDAANKMTRGLPLPENVHLLATDKPETRRLKGIDVAIHGQGFATQAIKENLAERYPVAEKGLFNIGLLHTCGAGVLGHEPYAPCSFDDLKRKGYDYWALGHIHQRGNHCTDGTLAAFSGNLQGRNIRETGPKGCLLVTVRDGSPQTAFRRLDVLRWERCAVDASDCLDPDAVLDRVRGALGGLRGEDDELLAVRVEMQGACPAHEALLAREPHYVEEVRSLATDAGGGDLWVEKVRFDTCLPQELAPLPEGPMEEVMGLIRELRDKDDELRALAREELEDLDRKLKAELKTELDSVRLEDPNWLRTVLNQSEPVLRHALRTGSLPA